MMMMEITMTKHAMEALTKKVGKDSKIALALIDSSDPFLRDKGACAKDSFFQIIPFFVEFGKYVNKKFFDKTSKKKDILS